MTNKLTYEESHMIDENGMLKLCNKCGEWKPCTEDHFYKNSRNKQDGLFPYCKQCAIDKSKKYIENNLDKHKIAMKKYRMKRLEGNK